MGCHQASEVVRDPESELLQIEFHADSEREVCARTRLGNQKPLAQTGSSDSMLDNCLTQETGCEIEPIRKIYVGQLSNIVAGVTPNANPDWINLLYPCSYVGQLLNIEPMTIAG